MDRDEIRRRATREVEEELKAARSRAAAERRERRRNHWARARRFVSTWAVSKWTVWDTVAALLSMGLVVGLVCVALELSHSSCEMAR